jgi:wyosine [tRNA(Phe)-imidazoG37] synthetase (radical SAM superfamily)
MKPNYKYLFGPVPSRRLGRSLGIDVTPFKTCSFDCVFCQCGCTTSHVTEREEFVPFIDVCSELELWLAGESADYITFAGSGEPTLYRRLGELIDFIKERTEIPVIVLSNGTLLHRQDVREDAARADIVKISLSAWDEESFQMINRPADGLSFASAVQGAQEFRDCFSGRLWLEVFLMDGVNTEPPQIEKIAAIARTIKPDRIHLNTAVRPPALTSVRPVAAEKLAELCGLFTPRAEVIASFDAAPAAMRGDLNTDSLVGLIRRHPATAEQLAAVSGAGAAVIRRVLAPLIEEGELQVEQRNGEDWYK